jgi:hypothetical protein
MRYFDVDTISFETDVGDKVAIKDMREYPEYTTAKKIKIRADDRPDEIATRNDVFGDDAEGDTYKIIDHNIADLFDACFDLSKLKQLRIPIR